MADDREPITVPGADPDWRCRVQRIDENRLLEMTKAFPHGKAADVQVGGLMDHAEERGLTVRDLIALGVELGRLHASRADCNLQELTRTEAGNLFEIVHAWHWSQYR